MNIIEIIKVLQNKVNNSATTEEIIYLSKAIELLNVGVIKTVNSFSDLSTSKIRDIHFVEDERNLYYFTGGKWLVLNDNISLELYSWGRNNDGQLGDDTTTANSSTVSVVGGFIDWTYTSAGGLHSLGIRANGTLWAWGKNRYGELGNNNSGYSMSRSSPVSVVGGFTDWVSASAGDNHSLGVRSNGTLWSWGNNYYGQLGDNTNTNRSSPVSVVGGFADWVSVDAGDGHSLGVRANGTLWAWGDNIDGQLGDGTETNRSSPVSVVSGFADWVSASAGDSHSLGVRANGTLWAWGRNNYGELGDGAADRRSSPVSVVGGFTDWVSVSAGAYHSLGIRANGTLWAWGRNNYGELGDGTTTANSSPVSVVGGFTDWISASAGGVHSLGVRSNGTLWAWGDNSDGQLGDGTTTANSSPVSVVSGFTDWISASAGRNHSLGIRNTG